VSTPIEGRAYRLVYLLKLAYLRLGERNAAALAPYGIDGRELALLAELADSEPMSQQQAAESQGIDRTTMVALVDGLEAKGLVCRRPDPRDRRRNVVEPTEEGRRVRTVAARAADEAERRFVAPLGEGDLDRLRAMLGALLAEDQRSRDGQQGADPR
jgi:DNA-binding MarR family transcriptional regulator